MRRARRPALFLVCLGLILTCVASPSAAAGRPAPPIPEVVSGFADGPLDIAGGSTFRSLGRVHVGRGLWIVVAKAFVEDSISTAWFADCRLVAGHRQDQTSVFPYTNSVSGPQPEPAVMAVATRITNMSGANLHVDCTTLGSDGDLKARFLKITAVRAGRLTVRDLGAGTTETFGDAGDRPVAIEAFRDGDVLPGATFSTVASMPLPTGAWSVMAKFDARSSFSGSLGESRPVACRLLAPGHQKDVSATRLIVQNFTGDRMSFALDVAPNVTGSGTSARLQCKTSATGDVTVSHVHLQAVRAGTLVRRNLVSGATTTFGSGVPHFVLGSAPGPEPVPTALTTIRSLHLPPGSWSVRATASGVDTISTTVRVTCELGLGGDFDRITAVVNNPGDPFERVPLTLSTVHASFPAGGGDAVLRCSNATGDGAVALRNIRMVALKVGVLSNSPLT
jgi:hypothetical protein